METNTVLSPVEAPATPDQKIDAIYQLLHDARIWLAQHNVDAAKGVLAGAETLVLDLRHGPSLNADPDGGYHAINEWVEVLLLNGMPAIKECCITARKHSQGGHVHYDLIYITHRDDDGSPNYGKLYHIPAGHINSLRKGE